jgi:endonuclease/exonuclease/phosphatase family metal-dependent hydrolase
VEFFLAVVDCLRGTIAGKLFKEELRFVPTRVAVCILLRELVAAGGAIDIARGLPIIHMNFLGYDEQAHRRGPSSLFAHWSLRGIDDAIKRLWESAHRSARREYDVWIYSDHGQEEARSYSTIHGITLQEALSNILARREFSAPVPQTPKCLQSKRNDFLRFFSKVFVKTPSPTQTLVAAMGPLGNIYLPHPPDPHERERFALACLQLAAIPNVLAADERDKAVVWSEKGRFTLPEDAETVFGPNHPFFEDIAKDLVQLCHHPDAGDFVILGWNRNGHVTSFMIENGTHAGPGVHETGAFALLPQDAPFPCRDKSYLRPMDLREGALRFLGRTPSVLSPPRKSHTSPVSLRVMTYNVHSSIGMDGRVSPDRIARVIARHNPDVIALQELDVWMGRTGGLDQVGLIAKKLEMSYHFHPSFFVEDGQFGNAVLSHFPMKLVDVKGFEKNTDHRREELRGALWILMNVHGIPVNLITTHLSIWPKERLKQADQLCADWLEKHRTPEPFVLCGDFNALPGSAVYKRFKQCLQDTQKILHPKTRPRNTWFGGYPLVRIDHVFVNSSVQVTDVRVPATRLERVASDHLPLVVELKLEK